MKSSLVLICFSFFLLFSGSLWGQKKAAYIIYNKKGKKVSYKKMLRTLKKNDIILFGEFHNNPISHWLELEVVKDLHEINPIILGAEMIETDNQTALDDYLNSNIDAVGLDTLARLWPNYKTDYAPLVDFAKDQKVKFIGTNIPRRFASAVYRKGGFRALDELSAQELKWVAPLPIPFDPELPQYKNILKMMDGHGSPALVKAQAIKDATMAHFILMNYQVGSTFLHFNGTYHSDFYEGILWYLQRQNPKLQYATITTVAQKNVFELSDEHSGRADFIICVDEDMTTTY
ncbi:MAG: ChaN family lipoprotein [Saprospiraceae bacterium]|nr:ChaN family lipoprotein [Saprospiraceae bacterium]